MTKNSASQGFEDKPLFDFHTNGFYCMGPGKFNINPSPTEESSHPWKVRLLEAVSVKRCVPIPPSLPKGDGRTG
jgi:hypothetical protein